MSESFVKFYLDTGIVPYSIVDAETGDAYPIEDEGIFETAVNLLNEQQDTIGEQKIAIDELITDYKKLEKENEQLKQEIKQHWKCRDKWKQEAKELKKEADYFERKKCEYWNMYNEAHSDRIILKKENEQLRKQIQNYEQLISNSNE